MTSLPAILQGLERARVRYLLIGGYASVIHGVPRTTVDVDLAVDPERENLRRAVVALRDQGLVPETNRLDEILGQGCVTATDDREVDLLTSLPETSFDAVWERHIKVQFRGVEIPVISRADQIRLLRAVGRSQDLEDAEVLESLESEA